MNAPLHEASLGARVAVDAAYAEYMVMKMARGEDVDPSWNEFVTDIVRDQGSEENLSASIRALMLIRSYRVRGHLLHSGSPQEKSRDGRGRKNRHRGKPHIVSVLLNGSPNSLI